MNNAQIISDGLSLEDTKEFDRSPWLRQREGELVKIIEAIGKIAETDEWNVLKTHIFAPLEETLEKRLVTEANKLEISDAELHRLQGQLIWAKKYADFKKLAEFFKLELVNVHKQLNKNG